jgi:GAF domain-containing protein
MFAEVSSDLGRDLEHPVSYEQLSKRAVVVVPSCELASVTLRLRKNRMETVGASDPLAREVDELQYALDEGPCLEAALDHEDCFVSHDLADDDRWPRWAPLAVERGIRSILGIRLKAGSETLGALNLFSSSAGVFEREAIDVGLIFGAHAAEALNRSRQVTGLQEALESRHWIGVAQGILMTRYDLDVDTSFEVLRRYASDRNHKLRDLAASVIEHGGLPDEPVGA